MDVDLTICHMIFQAVGGSASGEEPNVQVCFQIDQKE